MVQEEINGTTYSDIGLAQMALGGPHQRRHHPGRMAAAYCRLPRGGLYIEPRTYTRVEQADQHTGVVTVLLDNVQESHAAMKDSTAWYITNMLRNVVPPARTRAQISGMNVAGKTGTTTARRDLYFAGYTPYYTAAVWSGYDQPERMSSSLQQQSANTWRKVMSAIHEGLEDKSFPTPVRRDRHRGRLRRQRPAAHRRLPEGRPGGGERAHHLHDLLSRETSPPPSARSTRKWRSAWRTPSWTPTGTPPACTTWPGSSAPRRAAGR